MQPIIKVEGISKRYLIGASQADSLRDVLSGWARSPLKFFKRERSENTTVWALKDISFNIQQGEVVGVIGRNGAGKSTLLKILSRITPPTSGRIEIHGRVGSLLEMGTGFHPELTGRENIYLGGAILGMPRGEIRRKFDEIVAFSEIEKFIDTPVKYYSSGMIMRLAFSIPAHLEPEIMLLDEVLAVGDLAFQQKCFERMKVAKQSGMTILLVSHNVTAIQDSCTRSIYIDNGSILAIGDSHKVVEMYRLSLHLVDRADAVELPAKSHTGVTITGFEMFGPDGEAGRYFSFGAEVRIRINLHAARRIEAPLINFGIVRADGVIVCNFNNWYDNFRIDYIEGNCCLDGWLPPLRLIPHLYRIHVLVWAERRGGQAHSDLGRLQPLATATFGDFTIDGPPLTDHDGVFQEPARRWVFTRDQMQVEFNDATAESLVRAYDGASYDALRGEIPNV